MKPLLAFAAVACALAACSGMGGGPPPLPPPIGTEPTFGATEHVSGGAEPGLSGNDPSPGGGAGDSIPQLCAQFCARAAAACGGVNGSADQCTGSCTSEVTAAGNCQALYLDALHCLITQPLTCDAGSINAPNCAGALLAISQCTSSNQPPPTAGGTPTAP